MPACRPQGHSRRGATILDATRRPELDPAVGAREEGAAGVHGEGASDGCLEAVRCRIGRRGQEQQQEEVNKKLIASRRRSSSLQRDESRDTGLDQRAVGRDKVHILGFVPLLFL
jgi:hypothetical protein